MQSGKYYVIAEGNNLYESMTKEEILAAITQAVSTHAIADVDTGFVTTVKETNRNKGLTFWIGTSAEYNAIQTKVPDCFYILTDDPMLDDIESAVTDVASQVIDIAGRSIQSIDDYTVDGWNWHVHVHTSGFVEAWGAKEISNADVSTAEGNMYVVADGGFIVEYPTVLADSNGFTRKTASFGWDSVYYGLPFGRLGLSDDDYINIMRATSLTGVTGTLSIYMTGTIA